jgi:hypothetical protein
MPLHPLSADILNRHLAPPVRTPAIQSCYQAYDSDGEFLFAAHTLDRLIDQLTDALCVASVIFVRTDGTWYDASRAVAMAWREALQNDGYRFVEDGPLSPGGGDEVPGFLWLHLSNSELFE